MTKHLFQTIQFSISIQFSSIWPIERTLSAATTLGQSAPGSDGNEGVFGIPQSSSLTRTLPSDCLGSYLGHSFRGSYPSTEESVYSTDLADMATNRTVNHLILSEFLSTLLLKKFALSCRLGKMVFLLYKRLPLYSFDVQMCFFFLSTL